jgi:hypothetical protein
MVKIPDYQAQQGLQVGGGPSLPGVDTTGARALQSGGGAVADLGASLQSRQDKLQDDRDKSWFSKARADASVGWTERKLALKNGATGTDAAGFSDLAGKEWTGYRTGVAKGAPSERAKGMFDQWADAFGANDAVDSIDFREKSLFAARGADFESAFEAHKKSVVLDPKQYDRAVALFEDDLEIAKSWMTPEQERAARDKGLGQLQSARLGEIIRSDPAGFLQEVGGSAVENTVAKIIGVESGGRADAKNPRSSASGLGQFTDSTWLATVRKHRPDLAGASNGELLALKTDPTIGRQMTLAHTQENAAALAASGNATTEGNLYLAHFAGIAGAKRILAAADGSAIVDVLGADVVRANPFLRDQNIGWLKGWAAKKMGGQAPAPSAALSDPRFSHLTADQLVAYRDDAASILAKQETAQAAAMKAAYNQQINGLMTGILDGRAGRADVQAARDSGWLTDYDAIKKANDAIDTRDKKVVDAGRALGGVKLNQFSSDDKNAADAAVDLLTGQGVDPLVAVDQVYQSSGVVPPKAVQGLRGALAGGNPAAAESAMQVASSILAGNANAFAGADGGEDVAKQANAFRHFSELGMQPSQAARRVTEMNTPEYRAKNAVGDAEATAFVKKLTPSDVSSAFELGGSWLGMVGLGQGAAEIGFTYEQRNAVLSDFTELAEQRFRETGDEEVSKAYAKQVMSATYGETEFAGRRIFMKFPPSRAYPTVPRADGTPSTDYVSEQAAAAIKDAEGVDVAPADVILAPIPNVTSRDWSEGRLPRYSVSYWREENGQRVFETVHGQAFSADPALAEVASADARATWDAKATAARESARVEEEALAAGEAAPAIEGLPDWMNARDAEIAREGARMSPAPADEASALRAKLPEMQRRAISAAITAIQNGASAAAITKRLRDAGVPASLWPDEVK